jgi:predicted dehydrogenase
MLNAEAVARPHTAADAARPVRVAIAGAGFMGRTHSIAARVAGAEVVAVVASAPSRVDAAIEAVGAARGYTSLVDLLREEEVDVVHVCLPNRDHVAASLAALEAGRHVICEKPLATDVRDADLLARTATRLGLVAAVPFVYRFHPMVREMRRRIAAGQAGRIGMLHGSYLQDWLARPVSNWRVDPEAGGASRTFADIGSHWFDLLEFTTGDLVTAVSAQFSTVFDRRTGIDGAEFRVETEDSVAVQFRTERGVIGSFVGAQVAAGRKNRLALEVSGTDHSFAFDQEDPERLWMGDADGHRVLVRDADRLGAGAAEYAIVPSGHAQGYQDAFNAFVGDVYRAVAGSVPEGLPGFDAGARSALLVDAVVRSQAAGGAWTDVPAARIQEAVA